MDFLGWIWKVGQLGNGPTGNEITLRRYLLCALGAKETGREAGKPLKAFISFRRMEKLREFYEDQGKLCVFRERVINFERSYFFLERNVGNLEVNCGM